MSQPKDSMYLHYKEIEIPLYVGYLVVVITNCDKKIEEIIPDFHEGRDRGFPYAHALEDCWKKDQTGFFGVFNFENRFKKLFHGTIAHEAVHLATYILSKIGSYYDPENPEPFTYLVDWITDRIYEVFKEYGFKIDL